MDNSITVASMNCRGLADKKKRRDLMSYLKKLKHDIFFLQDTHFTEKLEPYIRAEWGYECKFASYTSNSRGVAILFNNSFEFKIIKSDIGPNGNYLFVHINMKDKDILLVNIYGPNGDSPEFYKDLKTKIKDMNIENVVWGGDSNLVLQPAKDYDNYLHVNNPNAKNIVDEIIDELNLCDIWRELNPDLRRYTWRRTNPLQQSRLDFFLISDTLVPIVSDADIVFGYRSDHSMITVTLKFSKDIKRNTFWKHNASLLKDKTYVDEINLLIEEVICEYAASPYNCNILG